LASLLQVARAFHFTEEVRLLLDDLKARFPNAPSLGGGFWGNSLVYLALAEGSSEDALRAAVLRRELELLASTGPARSWEQFGGYMNLLAAFLWEGDFNVDGSATVVLNNETPHPVSLKPHGPEASRSVRELDPAVFKEEPLMLELDTRNARLPVSVVLMGERISSPMIPAYPEQSIRRYREYREDTLLSGSRMEIVRIDSDPKLYPGDTLQVHITLYAEEVINFAEFVFAVPAGTSLSSDSIQHSYVPSSEDEVSPAPQITHMDQLDELSRIVRMEPFAPGRHEFILSYRINWAGEYLFPASRLILPKSGRIYSLGEPRMLEISERTDEESL
jgi:hypothetical protein